MKNIERRLPAVCLASLALPIVAAAAEFKAPSENMALGRPYKLDPPPNYALCKDPSDKVQLTDGQYTRGYFWTQTSTVGWNNTASMVITVDLGAVRPIRGVSFNTAAGRANVTWPAGIAVVVSDDGKTFYPAGELINLSMRHGAAPNDYAIHRFWTDALQTHGRYVSFLVTSGGPYSFVDEIEIYRGDESWLAIPFEGEGLKDARAYLLHAAFEQRIRKDALAIRTAANDLSGPPKQEILKELDDIEREIPQMSRRHDPMARVTLPFDPLHARIFKAQSMLWRANQRPAITLWAANPWDPIGIHALPPTGAPSQTRVAMMSREFRSTALNVANAGHQPLELLVSIEDLPGGTNPPYIRVHEVAWTDTRAGDAVAAALPDARRQGDRFAINVPAGIVRQIWFTFHPTDVEPGEYRGLIRLSADNTALTAPLALKIYPMRFPDRPSLHLGGWDYTDTIRGRDVTDGNRDALVRHLAEHFVDSPWASSAVMPQDRKTDRFDRWIALWPRARQYCVFAAVGESCGGSKMGTPEFDRKVRDWITFWSDHAKTKGLRPDQLVVLLVDEPAEERRDKIILHWARPIRAANTGIKLFEDVCHPDPLKADQEMIAMCDVLCPNRPRFLTSPQEYRDYFTRRRELGTELAFYSCNIGARIADPYAYFRLQAWTAWQSGAKASYFWSFGDSGGGSSWNEYSMRGTTCFTPVFLEPVAVTGGKHMEAIRESAEDYEYLVMLRDRVARAAKAGNNGPAFERAKHLLAVAAKKVLNAPDAGKLLWSDPKNRSIADAVRIEILDALAALD